MTSRIWMVVLSAVLPIAAAGQTITAFTVPTSNSNLIGIASGADGNLWFTEFAASQIGRISTTGVITEFPLPGDPKGPTAIAAGPDGNLWFVEASTHRIGRITTAGISTSFDIPTVSGMADITAGPDGNLWFTESTASKIGRITPAGVVTEFSLPTPSGLPLGIVAGPDGNLWFTESVGDRIGRITPSGVVTEFSLPASTGPTEIAAGPDGNLWFTEVISKKIGRISPGGVITEFPLPGTVFGLGYITAGPDGYLWFFIEGPVPKIGRISTAGVITEYPNTTVSEGDMTSGPDGNLWFVELGGNRIGRITTPALDRRILAVVGSTPGSGGTFFRTSVQLHNPGATLASGRVVFHRSGTTGSDSDVALSYLLGPGSTESIADLLPAMGLSGLGSADVLVASGVAPIVTARVFNDAGQAGTAGFTLSAARPDEALKAGESGVLLIPADLAAYRMNLGMRTLDAATALTLTVRNAGGAVVASIPRIFPAVYHEQQPAGAFLNGLALPPGGSITVAVNAGAAIVYGATVDNVTGDPSLQVARAEP